MQALRGVESKGGEWGSDLKFAMVTLRVANDNAVPMDVFSKR